MYGLNALNNIQYSILNSSRFNFEFRSNALHETKTETNTVYSLLDYCDYGQNEGIFYSLAHRGGDGRDDDDDNGNERRQTKRPNIFAYPSFYLAHKKKTADNIYANDLLQYCAMIGDATFNLAI